jgi:hypothetical protein
MATYKERNTQLMVWLPKPLHAELKRQSELRKLSMRKIVVKALIAYLFEMDDAS